MNEINKYLTSIGFTENDWGFLSHSIEGIAYTLLHDPISGYTLKYSYISKRTAEDSIVQLGKTPSLDDVQNAFLKILT